MLKIDNYIHFYKNEAQEISLYNPKNKKSLFFKKYKDGSFLIGNDSYTAENSRIAVSCIFDHCIKEQLVPQLLQHLTGHSTIYFTPIASNLTKVPYAELSVLKNYNFFCECRCPLYPRKARRLIAEHMIKRVRSQFSIDKHLSIMALGGGGLADIFIFINQLHQEGYTKFDLISVEPQTCFETSITIMNDLFAHAKKQGANIEVQAHSISDIANLKNQQFHVISGIDIDFLPVENRSDVVIKTATSYLHDDGIAFFSAHKINFELTKKRVTLFAPYALSYDFYIDWAARVKSAISRCTSGSLTVLCRALHIPPLFPIVKLVDYFSSREKNVTILYDSSSNDESMRMVQALCSIPTVTFQKMNKECAAAMVSESNICFFERSPLDTAQTLKPFLNMLVHLPKGATMFTYEFHLKDDETDLSTSPVHVRDYVHD